MSEIRMLSVEEFDQFMDIVVYAYPGWKLTSPEEKERVKERLIQNHEKEPSTAIYGLFRDGEMQGGMRFHDFRMNLLGVRIAAGGVGLVAVDLVHKKEHVAKEMIAFFLRYYREQGAPMALLYPFRPSFYGKMGFGYGTKMNQYHLVPSALPGGPSKAHVRYRQEGDRQEITDCYHRFVDRTHGMIEKAEAEVDRLMMAPPQQVIVCEKDERITGYMVYTFESGETFLLNDIHVREFVYEDQEALSEILTFLHDQADQIRHILFNTQDEFFHYLPRDPRNGSTTLIPHVYHETNIQGVGIMYRVIDVPGVFRALGKRDFGGQTCQLKLVVEDSFLPENAGSVLLHFESGELSLVEEGEHEVEIRLDVAEFSSLLVGAVNLRSLYRYGLVKLSDPTYLEIVDGIFAVRDKPICMTPF